MNNADTLPPEGIGVRGTGGNQINGKAAADSIYFIDNSKKLSGQGFGQLTTGMGGSVVLFNGTGNFSVFTALFSIYSAHDTLEFCELNDHLAHQVGLADLSSPCDVGLKGVIIGYLKGFITGCLNSFIIGFSKELNQSVSKFN